MWTTLGHKKAISLFQGSLERDRFAHAYLLVGPAHVGKMTLARDLARALNCESERPPCGECASCRRIEAGKHSDVQEIGLTRNPGGGKSPTEIGIDDIRQLQHSANLPPFEGKRKVFIIDGAEHLSIEAANCLLKTLEEPSPGAVFIALTTNEQLLPATVVSRCQRVELAPLPAGSVEAALVERWDVAPDKARLLSLLSHGCLGWAVIAKDDGSLGGRNEQLDDLIGIIDGDNEARFTYAANLATDYGKDRESVYERLSLWLDWWRDLMLVRTGLVEKAANIDRMDVLSRMAQAYELTQIRSAIESILEAGEQLRLNANPRLALEVLMLELPEGKTAITGS
jgi:DNA polymerase-3 subunit delta'